MISNPMPPDLILPTVRTRQCRFPTINRAMVTYLPSAHDYFGVSKRHGAVSSVANSELFLK